MIKLFLFFELIILISFTNCIIFTVPAGKKECFYDDAKKEEIITIQFQVIRGGDKDIDLSISSPNNDLVYTGLREVEGKYSFVAKMDGQYAFCFDNSMSSVTQKEINTNIQIGKLTKDSELAKKEDLTPLEKGILNLEERLISISEEQKYFKVRERVHRDTAESSNARVLWWSFFKTLLIVGMSVGQIYFLRRFFEVKRRV
ncbi:transmembrane emp24 domain-containing protein a [Anaeramoeba ignava]|uniref:Transmembrane emp24 domain-containing protein a n=1 Tax=Anaeramoeba ignava TaxID=1746090 RepID=A0A9Q0R993_ANAIG|nr:transmembrane emp24 domain-containing protein a [Anaeramoeba ignava]|eukprot:Anaeramoba_ignava/c73722_g1_i1.p1 GENE.c73722_g1_i1~~c73722_g1_i1.p1  ORF type:complete len:201 (+),score=54.10 c73722_g1_i1:22-624(+)